MRLGIGIHETSLLRFHIQLSPTFYNKIAPMIVYSDFDLDQPLVYCKNRISVFQQLDIRIRQFFLCSFSSLRWVEVQGVKMIDFFDSGVFETGSTDVHIAWLL